MKITYDTPQEICPNCRSDDIANEQPSEGGLVFVACHACSHRWHEPTPKYAKVEWTASEVAERLNLTEEQAAKFLTEHEASIQSTLIERGWDVLDDLWGFYSHPDSSSS